MLRVFLAALPLLVGAVAICVLNLHGRPAPGWALALLVVGLVLLVVEAALGPPADRDCRHPPDRVTPCPGSDVLVNCGACGATGTVPPCGICSETFCRCYERGLR